MIEIKGFLEWLDQIRKETAETMERYVGDMDYGHAAVCNVECEFIDFLKLVIEHPNMYEVNFVLTDDGK